MFLNTLVQFIDPRTCDACEDCRGEALGDPDQQDGRPDRQVGAEEIRLLQGPAHTLPQGFNH